MQLKHNSPVCSNQVTSKMALLGEELSTQLTSEWFLPGVNALVGFKQVFTAEVFSALCTNIPPGVSAFMRLEDVQLEEALVTHRAGERFFPAVNLLVHFQDAGGSETLAALRTAESFPRTVLLLMRLQFKSVRERLPTAFLLLGAAILLLLNV